MPKGTKTLGYDKALACESRSFEHKKEGALFDTPSIFFREYWERKAAKPLRPLFKSVIGKTRLLNFDEFIHFGYLLYHK